MDTITTLYRSDNETMQTSLLILLLDDNKEEETISMKRVAPVGLAVGLLTAFTIVGNLLTIIAVVIEPKLHKFENYFFASLAVADLSIGVVVMPMQLRVEINGGQWYSSNFACDLFIFTDVTCCTASILNLCAIGLNRYWSISSPLKYATKQTTTRAGITISIVWILSVIIASPPLFGWPTRVRRAHTCMYDTDHAYVIYSSFGSFFIPLLLLSVVYYKIFRLAKQGARFRRAASSYNRPKRASSTSNCYTMGRVSFASDLSKKRDGGVGWGKKTLRRLKVRRHLTKADQAEMKTVKTLGVIMGTFVACWLPFFTLYLLVPFCGVCKVPQGVDRFALWLGYTNSLLNPIIYICCKSVFRKTFKKIICLNYCRTKEKFKVLNRPRRGMYNNILRRNCDGEEEQPNPRKMFEIQDDCFSEDRIETPSKNTGSKLSCSPSSWSARKERLKQVTLNLVPQVRKFSSWKSKDSLENLEGRTIMTSFVTEMDSEPETYLSKSDSHLHRCGIFNQVAKRIIESEDYLAPRFIPRVRSFPNIASGKMQTFENLPITVTNGTSLLSVPKNEPLLYENNGNVQIRLSEDVQETVDQNDPHGIKVIVTVDTEDYINNVEISPKDQSYKTHEMENRSKESITSSIDLQCNMCTERGGTSLLCICKEDLSRIKTEVITFSEAKKQQKWKTLHGARNDIGGITSMRLDTHHNDTLVDYSEPNSTTDSSQISEEDFLRGKVRENICRRHIKSEDCIDCRRFTLVKETGVQTIETRFHDSLDLSYSGIRLEDQVPDLIASARLSEIQVGLTNKSSATRSLANDAVGTDVCLLRRRRNLTFSGSNNKIARTTINNNGITGQDSASQCFGVQNDIITERRSSRETSSFSGFDDRYLNVLVYCKSSDL